MRIAYIQQQKVAVEVLSSNLSCIALYLGAATAAGDYYM